MIGYGGAMRPYGPNPEKPWRGLAMTLLSLAIVAGLFWFSVVPH